MSSTRVRHRPEPGFTVDSAVTINGAEDIVAARSRGRALAAALGFSGSDLVVVVTVISELAHNIIQYATTGEIVLGQIEHGGRRGIVIVARDQGPGIANAPNPAPAGYCAGQNIGLGLPGVRRLMDECDVSSVPDEGTTVTARKWLR